MWPFPQVSQCLSPGMSSGCLSEAPLSTVYLGQLSQISSSRDFGQIMARRQRMCFCDCLPSGSYLSSLFITSSWGGSAMPGRHGQYLFPGLWCIWPHCGWWATLLTGNIHPLQRVWGQKDTMTDQYTLAYEDHRVPVQFTLRVSLGSGFSSGMTVTFVQADNLMGKVLRASSLVMWFAKGRAIAVIWISRVILLFAADKCTLSYIAWFSKLCWINDSYQGNIFYDHYISWIYIS